MSLPPDDPTHNHIGLEVAFVTGLLVNYGTDKLYDGYRERVDQVRERIDAAIARGDSHLATLGDIKRLLLALDYLFFDCMILNQDADSIILEWMTDTEGRRFGETQRTPSNIILRLHGPKHSTSLELVGTILHEMVHMYVQKVWSQARFCDQACYDIQKGLIGVSGHGYHWQNLLRYVEKRGHEMFGLNQVCLGRAYHVYEE